ncbi:MAG: type II toxin-antitoxin system VapC family toxin [Pseudomonadota bacterium]
MMRYSLDTNIVIALMAGNIGGLREKAAARFQDGICVSSIVMFELMHGAYNSARVEQNLDRLSRLAFPILDFVEADAKAAGEIRAQLKRAGTPIGHYDLLIAAQAKGRGLVMVTNNVTEFSRVEGLVVEDWIDQASPT